MNAKDTALTSEITSKISLMTPDQPRIPLSQSGPPIQLGAPIQVQPGSFPMPNINCPPGLEYLTTLDRLMIDCELILCEGTKYDVKDFQGRVVYRSTRNISCCDLCCWRKDRLLNMRILDEAGREVIHLHYAAESCTCSLPQVEVYSNGIALGSVIENWSFFHTSFSVRDANGDTVLTIASPRGCNCDYNLDILSSDGEHKVGRLSLKKSLATGEIDLSFPCDLDVRIKAVLLGGWFLINELDSE